MFKKSIDLIKELHEKYSFQPILLDAGGVFNPLVADYDISVNKAVQVVLEDGRIATVPHAVQNDRYIDIVRPWEFIDKDYVILNPAKGDPYIEKLPDVYPDHFNTIIMTSVIEHVRNPYEVVGALFKIMKSGGYIIITAPFEFPKHGYPEDNWRFSPIALQNVCEKSGFKWVEGDFFINYLAHVGIGSPNNEGHVLPHSVVASFSICKKE